MARNDRDAVEARLLAEALAEARRIAIFTGAGISTESGIPDFRGPSGLWKSTSPITFQQFVEAEEARIESWQRNVRLHDLLARCAPNRGHRAVAALIGAGRAACVITQNIDGLHQAAGLADDQVIEIHGSTRRAACLACFLPHEMPALFTRFAQTGRSPRCLSCGGIVKTATISFGQAMPEAEMARAEAEIEASDLVLVLGSSLRVHPAAGLPEMAARQGKTLVIINAEPTPLDPVATLVIHGGIGRALGDALGLAP